MLVSVIKEGGLSRLHYLLLLKYCFIGNEFCLIAIVNNIDDVSYSNLVQVLIFNCFAQYKKGYNNK